MLFQLSNSYSCPRIFQNYGKNLTAHYLITGGQVTVYYLLLRGLFLTNPQKSNRRKFCRCRSWRVTPWSFTLLHLPTFRDTWNSSKIRSSLLYFSAAITFERFKTFCLHSSPAETETFTRERNLIPIDILSNRTVKEKIATFSTISF